MPSITLITLIDAPVETVFDLARSIDLHQQSMRHTSERAVAGRLSGLIDEGESVTWEARHFFRKRRLTSHIVSMKRPHYFRDEMVEGDFALLRHDHYFSSKEGHTEMKDVFVYKSPYGFFGRIAELIFLNSYLRQLLKRRNRIIKKTAEQQHSGAGV